MNLKQLMRFWNLIMPKCHEVIWDDMEGHLAVRYYGTPGPGAGMNSDIYDAKKARVIAGIALSKGKPVYTLNKGNNKIRVFTNPVPVKRGA